MAPKVLPLGASSVMDHRAPGGYTFGVFLRPSSRVDERGQAIVELVAILPVLALLLVMAVDAGRVFFGWVALQNASRIGADYAAGHADAWDGPPDGLQQNQRDRYQLLVQNDLQALGCQGNPVPAPDFDPGGDGTSEFTDGSLVRVALTCDFSLVTPLAESFLGGIVTLNARTDFAINRTINTGLPGPVAPPPPVGCEPGEAMAPTLVGETMADAYGLWAGAGFTGTYQPGVTNPNKHRVVQSQSVAAGQCFPLTTSVLVTYA